MIMTAITAPMLLTVIGFAADYGFASYINNRLARACDTAVLTSTSQSAATAVGGYANTTALQTYGTNIFNENIKDLPIGSVNFQLTVSQDPNTTIVTSVATYAYSTQTFFSNLFGITSIPVAGTIRALVQPPTYVNYYILVDVSNSMGIGATQSDMAALYNRLNQLGFKQNGETGCVFACHDANSGSNYTYTTEQIARQLGITLRLDSAIAAIQSIINSAASIAGSTKNISFGLYLLQNNPNTGKKIVTLSAPSNNYANLLTLANTIDLGSNSGSNTVGDTDFQAELNAFNALLPANGSGASAASPLNYVFLVSDGVSDVLSGYCSGSSCVYPINPSWCSPIKTKSTLGVIYTTYLPIWKNNDAATNQYELLYNAYVQPIAGQILPNLQSCATSSSYFFQATDGPSITTTMQALFAKTQPISGRLTQ